MLGLALDLGRVYIAKNETQSFTDTAALAAAAGLNNGSFAVAQDAVAANTKNKWNMGNNVFTSAGVTTEFARALSTNASRPDAGTWAAMPPTVSGYTFVRVTASVAVPLSSSFQRPAAATRRWYGRRRWPVKCH